MWLRCGFDVTSEWGNCGVRGAIAGLESDATQDKPEPPTNLSTATNGTHNIDLIVLLQLMFRPAVARDDAAIYRNGDGLLR